MMIPCKTNDFPNVIQSFARRANLEEVLVLETQLGLALFSLASLEITLVPVELQKSEKTQESFRKTEVEEPSSEEETPTNVAAMGLEIIVLVAIV